MFAAQCLLALLLAYLFVGLAFGAAFVSVGVRRLDPAARGTSLGFRLLILPGSVALWPYLAGWWLRAWREDRKQS